MPQGSTANIVENNGHYSWSNQIDLWNNGPLLERLLINQLLSPITSLCYGHTQTIQHVMWNGIVLYCIIVYMNL